MESLRGPPFDSIEEIIVKWIGEGLSLLDLNGSDKVIVFLHVAGSIELCLNVEGSIDPLLELAERVDISVCGRRGEHQI